MQIGVMNHPARDPIAEIEWIGDHGFDFVDLTLEPPAADPERIDPRAIKAALQDNRLGVVAHTAYYLPLGSPFARVRESCLQEFRSALKVAHQIMNMKIKVPSRAIQEMRAEMKNLINSQQ